MKPYGIILLASERSGSNLLRTLLGNHSNISAPIAPHLITIFYPIKHYYLNLTRKGSRKNLFQDMLQIVNHPFPDWRLKLNYNEIELLEIDSVIKMMDYLYKKEAERNQKEHYCSKGINTFRFIDQMRKEVPTMKFIHLVRDPRDVVASWLKRKSSLNSSYDAILQWKKQQKLLNNSKRNSGFHCITIKYEDLISDTSIIMDKIMLDLGLPIDHKCYETNSLNKESKKSKYWKNLSKPIMANNINKFKAELCQEDILMIETIAEEEMREYGYSPLSNQDWKINRKHINFINEQRKIRKREAKKNMSDSNQLLMSKQKLIRETIAERRKKYLSSESFIGRVRNFMKFNIYKIIKRYILQFLGRFRITFIIRNYIHRN